MAIDVKVNMIFYIKKISREMIMKNHPKPGLRQNLLP